MPGARYDVIVVGGGPAGAACATLLGRRGLRVLLLDKARFPRYKLCTHAIMPAALPVLAELGVLGRLDAAGAQRWYGVHLCLNGTRFSEPLPSWKTAYPYGLSLRRVFLDEILLDAARQERTVTVCTEAAVTALLRPAGRVCGVLAASPGGREMRFESALVVLAGGRHTRLVRQAGVKTFMLPNRHSAYFAYIDGIPAEAEPGLEGYYEHGRSASLLPADGGLRVAGVMTPTENWASADREQRLLAELRRFPTLRPRLAHASVVTRPVAAFGLRNIWRGPSAPGVLLLGDAGIQTDPLFGQGISWALRGAAQAATDIAAGFVRRDPDSAARAHGGRRLLVFGHRFLGMSLISMIEPASTLERLFIANAVANPASTSLLLRLMLGYTTVSRGEQTPRTMATWIREVVNGPRWHGGPGSTAQA